MDRHNFSRLHSNICQERLQIVDTMLNAMNVLPAMLFLYLWEHNCNSGTHRFVSAWQHNIRGEVLQWYETEGAKSSKATCRPVEEYASCYSINEKVWTSHQNSAPQLPKKNSCAIPPSTSLRLEHKHLSFTSRVDESSSNTLCSNAPTSENMSDFHTNVSEISELSLDSLIDITDSLSMGDDLDDQAHGISITDDLNFAQHAPFHQFNDISTNTANFVSLSSESQSSSSQEPERFNESNNTMPKTNRSLWRPQWLSKKSLVGFSLLFGIDNRNHIQ